MDNSEILGSFRQVCKYLYYFLVETLPGWLNFMTTPLSEVISNNPYLETLYGVWSALLPDAIVDNLDILFQNTSLAQALVTSALGLLLTFSLVRAIVRLFVGTL